MARLVLPTVAVHRSYLAAWDELEPGDERWMGAYSFTEEQIPRSQVSTPEGFAQLVEELKAQADPFRARLPHLVPMTSLWFVEGDEWLGRLSIRHELTPQLHELGGHIGYVVRPSARRQGYATQMLEQSLPFAAKLGIDPALVTCDEDNDASRKVIEACGGEFEDNRHGKLRYWVPTRTT
ncbi:GNAT family N-acetyltransferase [Kribbella sp. NBC_01245]|uniref:GNAT family N-acetyltransferase n=1 Tax=Kribbella sp. NBC_01245 TaxID=2903578 RepID=UPI002E2CF245|nr:GNAT family N-acetyltransferase [Kribbella sp. NBC_01245]